MGRFTICFVMITPWLMSSGRVASVWRPPAQPNPCRDFPVEFAILDISKSMARDGRFASARQSLSESIDQGTSCGLFILGTFGVTADVRAAEFLTDASARERLKAALVPLKPEAGATNLDEAAKAVELLTYQLREAYGRQASTLFVTAYTDNIPSPSVGKEPFSLAEYLTLRLNAKHLQLADADSPLPPPPPGVNRIRLGRSKLSSQDGAALAKAENGKLGRGLRLSIEIGLALALMASGLLALRRRRRRAAGMAFDPGATVIGVMVTETGQAGPDAKAEVLGRDIRLAAASGLPVAFSTDPNRGAYIVAPGEGIPVGELFCLFPYDDGTVAVEGAPGMSVAGRPLAEKRVTVDAREGVVIAYGNRTFQIRLLFAAPAEEALPLRRTA